MRKAGSELNVFSQAVSLFIYRLSLSLYAIAARVLALFNAKAAKWVAGRKNWEQRLATTLNPGERRIWVHCSSMGEYEQAKPLLEVLRSQYPVYKIVVTFFSPSGFEACKDSALAEYVFYLPHDSNYAAEKFISLVDPSLVLFVKYEFWYFYLQQLKLRNIPALLVSGAFRKEQAFFKWYGGLLRSMLRCFTYFFLQDQESERLLQTIGIRNNVLVSGDTRYDRVAKIAAGVTPIPAIEKFKGGKKILIAGSTWPGDESVLKEALTILPADWKLILVPHEIGEGHIKSIQDLFGVDSILFSELNAVHAGGDKRILIINNIGMLSRLFAYGDIAFIGGGFQKGGIHNVLEPAVFGLPVVFGPVYEKFVEAKELATLRLVFPVNNAAESNLILSKMVSDAGYRHKIGESLKRFMQEHVGASNIILGSIEKEKWLNYPAK